MMKALPYLVFSILTILTAYNCNNPTDTPPPDDNIPAGSRDYEWTLDTIKTDELLYLSRIWGSSPNDVWAVGPSSWSATSVWHFDGTRWECDSSFGVTNPLALYGSDQSNIWIGNTEGIIWKYNGSHWDKQGQYKLSGFQNTNFQNFWGTSATNILGVGFAQNTDNFKGVIIHYDGSRWKFLNIPDARVAFLDVRVDKKSGMLVMESYNENYDGRVYTWNGKDLKEIYSGEHQVAVSNVGETVIVTVDSKIYKFENGGLKLWIDKTGSTLMGKAWAGRSEKDFFWNSAFEGIVHYNGNDFQLVYKTHLNMGGGFIFEKDVFFILYDNQQSSMNYILHGKLKE